MFAAIKIILFLAVIYFQSVIVESAKSSVTTPSPTTPKTDWKYVKRTSKDELLIQNWEINNPKLNESAKISLSRNKAGYLVFIKFTKVCSIYHPPREWFNVSDIQLMKTIGIGPDEIVIQLEGSSIQTKIALSQNFCNEYYQTFQVPLGGLHNLKVYRLRRHYESAREVNKFPKMIYEEFLSAFVDLPVHYPLPCGDSLNGYWVSHWDRFTNVPINIRQRCLTSNERRGLKLTTNVLVSSNFGKVRCAYDVDLYSWNRQICSPRYDPVHQSFGEEVNEHRPNLTDTSPKGNQMHGKKILFVGDSHMRGLADLFLYHVCKFQIKHVSWNSTYVPLDKSDTVQPRAAYLEIKFLKKTADAFRKNCNLPGNHEQCTLFHPGTTYYSIQSSKTPLLI
jgi:hypothetical protein